MEKNLEKSEGRSEKKWSFSGTPGQFFSLVHIACVGYELHSRGRPDALRVLADPAKFDEAVAEFGITFEAVKKETAGMVRFMESVGRVMVQTENSGEDEG